MEMWNLLNMVAEWLQRMFSTAPWSAAGDLHCISCPALINTVSTENVIQRGVLFRVLKEGSGT